MAIPVKLEVFEGPLDLLLHLIEKHKIDIYDIPIVLITDQYLEYIEKIQTEDMDTLSEFLVMAATLIRIKSKMLIPPDNDKEDGDEDEDPRTELVSRLLEYKMYKYASYELKNRQADASRVVYKKQDMPEDIADYEEEVDTGELLYGVTMKQLQDIFEMILKRKEDRVDPIRSRFGRIEKEEISISDRIADMKDYIKGKRNISFRDILSQRDDVRYVIVSFLAVLELMKTGIIYATQSETGDDIILSDRGEN